MTNETGLSATLWRASERDWREAVALVRGERGFDSLVGRTDDGLAIGPIYPPEARGAPVWRREQGPWVVVQRIDDPDRARANEAISAALAGGATGIELVFDGSASAARAGFGLESADIGLLTPPNDSRSLHVRLDLGAAAYEQQSYRFLNSAPQRELVLCFDPLADAAARGGFDRPLADLERALVRTASDFRQRELRGCPVAADGRVWAAAGASEAQEVAGILGTTTHCLRVLTASGLSPREGLESIGLIVDAGANQLLTIAKLRALRLCHGRLVEAFGTAPIRARLHAETSWRMMTRYDIHTNILRSTSAALAAGIAGADSITVLPCTIAVGVPDAFARRMAQNTQAILLEESALAQVDDPGAGAGAVESLTEAIAEAAWNGFRELETAGGLAAALRSGRFQRTIAATRRARTEKIARRQTGITGISYFPKVGRDAGSIATDRPPRKQPPPSVELIPRLEAERFAEAFERLRDRAAELADAGTPPQIFLANLGPGAEFADSARSALNFFAAGGISVVDAGGFDTPQEAAAAFAASGASAACITGGPDTLRRLASATATALRERGAARVYMAGANWGCDAVDTTLDETTDAVSVLTDFLTPLR